MLSFLAVLLPFFPIILCDVFTRDDCWCRNATHLGWKRHFELDGVNIEGDPLIMDQWCFQATHDGRGKCLDWHTIQYRVCASHQAAHNASRRNDFCYYNHGNFRGAVTLWSKGDDAISKSALRRTTWSRLPTVSVWVWLRFLSVKLTALKNGTTTYATFPSRARRCPCQSKRAFDTVSLSVATSTDGIFESWTLGLPRSTAWLKADIKFSTTSRISLSRMGSQASGPTSRRLTKALESFPPHRTESSITG